VEAATAVATAARARAGAAITEDPAKAARAALAIAGKKKYKQKEVGDIRLPLFVCIKSLGRYYIPPIQPWIKPAAK
jgi:hypothetical protein